MDYLSLHLFQALEFLVNCLKSGSSDEMLRELRFLGQVHGSADVPTCAYPAITDCMIALMEKHIPDFTPELSQGWATLMERVINVIKLPKLNDERLLKKAKQFLEVIASEQAWELEDKERRWQEIKDEVKATSTYTHTYEELAYGTQLAWRNASKCVGRIAWNNMVVRDRRHVTDPDEMFRELGEHVRFCPLLHPQKIQITVGVLQIQTDTGKVRQGLCSNYLAGLEPGSKVRIGVRTSGFRPPADPQAPMLMVGPGTGVSPLIAFLQYREAIQTQGTQLGDACLYFGCRNHDDFLYGEQLGNWQNQGVLTNLEVAFSRLTDRKVYVQGLMAEKAEQIWDFLNHPQCNYYVCGDAKMADDVFEVFLVIAKTVGELSHIEAVEFFERMKKENRFHADVWGVQLHFQQVIKQVQKDNYSKAEKWLNRVKQSTNEQAAIEESQPLSV
ncbi:nitric oxide synthase oxygenase [Nostoc sp. UHCC 0302]|uniref:nitric oxide synthase oxygenase n=1 Tax=Nostoc sp. UHCC 0302 TaxID=3134896 RepID=UPI00311CC3B1